MLKKHSRLKNTLLNSSFFSTPYFNLKFQINRGNVSRFGFIVSKRIDKRAVVRNRIKRVLRSCIERNTGSIKKGYDFSFIIKNEAVGMNREELCRVVLDSFGQNKLLK